MGLFERLFKREIEETEEQGRILQIVAVTGPEGVMGSRGSGEGIWLAGIMLTAWRLSEPSAPVHEEPKRLMLEVDDEKLKWMQRMVKKESVVRLKVQEVAGGFWLEEVLDSYCTDVEMQEICRAQQEPVYYEDQVLGSFSLNRGTDSYEQVLQQSGSEIRLTIENQDEEQMQLAMETARILMKNLEFWMESAAAYAADELLEAKNGQWLEEGEEKLSREAFLASLWLNDILAKPGGNFRFWYSDGEMLGGHSIYVDGNVYGRFQGAGM